MVMSKEYREKHKEHIKKYMHEYYLSHKKEWNEYCINWRKLNPDKAKNIQKRCNNNMKIRERRLKWISNNKDRYQISKTNYHKNYLKNKDNLIKIEARKIAKLIPLKENCEICKSDKNLERHHWNYNKPNMINTLCSTCHKIQHIVNFDSSIYRGGEYH